MKTSIAALLLVIMTIFNLSCKKKLKGDTLIYDGHWSSIEHGTSLIYYGQTQMDINLDGSVFYSHTSGFDKETIDGNIHIKNKVLKIKFLGKAEKTFNISKEPFMDSLGKVMVLNSDTFRVL